MLAIPDRLSAVAGDLNSGAISPAPEDFKNIYYLYMRVSRVSLVSMCVNGRIKKRELDPSHKLELQAVGSHVIRVPGTERRYSERAAGTLMDRAISLSLSV